MATAQGRRNGWWSSNTLSSARTESGHQSFMEGSGSRLPSRGPLQRNEEGGRRPFLLLAPTERQFANLGSFSCGWKGLSFCSQNVDF